MLAIQLYVFDDNTDSKPKWVCNPKLIVISLCCLDYLVYTAVMAGNDTF